MGEAGTERTAVVAPALEAHPVDVLDRSSLDAHVGTDLRIDLDRGLQPEQGSATAVIDYPEGTSVTVVTVAGTVDAEPITRLVDMLAAQYVDGDVVVDLTPVMMTNRPAIRALVARLSEWADTTSLRIVCSRLTARRVLRRWGGGGLPLCASLAGALDSLTRQATPSQPSASNRAVPASG